ncbi:hypothetical protein CARUB_v10024595mg [Capsella rubella]|uniref:MATH domain-containing protein n=1 Tax=Capsella rubella TaxID=81985 RepID=R0HFG4_9BRAS|nr:hypothetical protein CARUB_v10024595mg [Capsella rubella]
MWSDKPSFRFEINNFSKREVAVSSQTFVSGGCEWHLTLHPKGDGFSDDLALFLTVSNSKSLGKGWERRIDYYFLLLNHSDNELHRSSVQKQTVFKEKAMSWGFRQTLPVSKFQEKGFLEKDKLIFEVYIQNVEAFDGEGGDVSSEKVDTVDINGFKVLASQANTLRKIFAEHPDFAKDFKLKNQVVRMEYMKVLLNLIVTLEKPSKNHSELSNAHSDLSELTEAGFKLDWLQSKLDEVYLKRKKADADVQQLDERVKKLEQMKVDVKLDCLMKKLEEVSLERKKSYDLDCSLFVDRVKNLELMELGFKLDSLETKLEKFLMETKNADADGSRVQQVEESVKNLKMMVLDLKVEVDKKKTKSCADGFMLVDDIA